MMMNMDHPPRLASIRPLVRYVDEGVAVIDVQLAVTPPLPMPAAMRSAGCPEALRVALEVQGPDGFMDEQTSHIQLKDHTGTARLQVVQPQRWWPAGMGEQSLYTIRVTVMTTAGDFIDSRTLSIGFTSIRHAQDHAPTAHPIDLLINGQECPIEAIVPIDLVHEKRLLPVRGQSVLLVRGHYGPDVLYEAADRAGILLIQCVPLDPEGTPEADVPSEVDRLSSHPSLAGWFVGHLGEMSSRIERRLRNLDPTHNVFRHMPSAK